MTTPFRILHVDDNALTRQLVELSLARDPAFVLLSCAGAREALRVATDWGPDLILCEAEMPEMDGPEFLQRLRAQDSKARFPVVFMSACTQSGHLESLRALGAAGVIEKPFDPQTLPQTPRRLLFSLKLNDAGHNFHERPAARYSRPRVVLRAARRRRAGGGMGDAVLAARAGCGTREAVAAKLDALIECIARS